jgi:hypothetical protein
MSGFYLTIGSNYNFGSANGSYSTVYQSDVLVSINNVTNLQENDLVGTSNTNNTKYNVYAFKTTGINYTINYTATKNSPPIYVLAVGGGGGGGCNGGGGGGGGGVIMTPISLPEGSGSIDISIGEGGLTPVTSVGTAGGNTTVNFSAAQSQNITAGGGAGGGVYAYSSINNNINSSGGGGGLASNPSNANTNYLVNSNNPSNYLVYVNNGGTGNSNGVNGGGGGAGTPGSNGSLNPLSVPNGGNGIKCVLPTIKNFAPYGIPYGNYYWGGGGGGSSAEALSAGNGGPGGGGGGVHLSTYSGGRGGGFALNIGGDGGNNNGAPGNGGANTGGGGGGSYNNGNVTSQGGSGIVIIALPLITFYLAKPYADPAIIVSTPLPQITAPVPDLIWLKFDETTYTGIQRLTNAASSGSITCNFWNVNGTITNITSGENTVALISNTTGSIANGYWNITSSEITIITGSHGMGYTLCYWLYVPIGGLPNQGGITCMLASFIGTPDSATQGWIDTYFAGNYFNGSGSNISNIVNWYYPGAAYNDNTFTGTTTYSTWYHISIVQFCTANNSSNVNIYKNGTSVNTTTSTYPTSSQSVNFGIATNLTSAYYSDVRVYGRPLIPEEITSVYNYGISIGINNINPTS